MGDISQHIRNWEECLVGKDRSRMSQAQRIDNLLMRLRERRFYNRVAVDGWEVAYARFDGIAPDGSNKYTWLDKRLIPVGGGAEAGEYKTCDKPQWQPLEIDQSWGDLYVTAFIRTKFTVPKAFDGKKMFMLFFVGGDGMLYVNGEALQGVDCFHTELYMADFAKAGKTLAFEVETYQKHEVDVERFHDLMVSDMALLDEDVEGLYWDMKAALSGARENFATDENRKFILNHLDEAFKQVDIFETDQAELAAQARKARKYLAETIYARSTGSPATKHHTSDRQIAAVGHSHLDIVYKWEYPEFLRKCERTHTTQLRLMEEFPEFKFSQSQAITYLEMKRRYPKTFKKIQERVKKGNWEILGVMFSESDMYLPNGESHIRNIMLGKRFFEQEFNVRPTISWNCDLFGVAWSLPQILKKCGVDYFVTHKMSIWNTDNYWPYNIYWWEGLDGSRVLSHTPSTHIIQTCEGFQLQKHWEDFKEKVPAKESLYTYGWGDGGSGVMRDMIHRGKRYKDFPGVPHVDFERAEDFFARVAKNVQGRSDLPVWSNELYVETHRGTFTTQGILKKLNRYAEILYRNAELLSCLAMWMTDASYPQAEFNEGWQELLKAQFHDGVTGTHTLKAFGNMMDWYGNAIRIGEAARDNALKAISKPIDTRGSGQPLMLFNTQTWDRNDPVILDYEANTRLQDEEGEDIVSQTIEQFGEKKTVFYPDNVPSVGYKVVRLTEGLPKREESPLKVSENLLENEHVRVRLDADGHVKSFYDKREKRECIRKGELGNEFQLFEDISGYYEAWDLHDTRDVHQWEVRKAESVKVMETGPLRAAVEVRKPITERSSIVQRIVLWRDANWVDFETTVDWDESHKCLKVAFPLDIQSFEAQYDIAYGNMPRPTHRTTTWEQSKFEVPAHKWADLSDAGFGVSLINDCKYGYDCEWGRMRLTLLRAPKLPNPESDIYTHTFTYRLLAHQGDWRQGGTVRNAWELNCPVLTYRTNNHNGELPAVGSLLKVDRPNVMLEACKKAEDDDDVIVRFVEHHGRQDQVLFSFADEVATVRSVREVNLVEDQQGKASKPLKSGVKFQTRPYEINSLKLKAAKKVSAKKK